MVAVENRCPTRFCTIAGALAIGFGLAVLPARAQQIEPEADKILHSMAEYVAGLKAFTVNYDADSEVIDTEGQKLQYSASGSVALERPGKLRFSRKGTFVDAELTFDGKTISVYGKEGQCLRPARKPRPNNRRSCRRSSGCHRF